MADLVPGAFLAAFALGNHLSDLLGEAFVDAPLTPREFALTSALRLTEPIRPTQLAGYVGLRPTTLSNYLARLGERDLVLREVDPKDRRAALLRLTERGRAATEACFPAFGTAVAAYRASLTEVGSSWEEASAQLRALADAMARAVTALPLVEHPEPDGALVPR